MSFIVGAVGFIFAAVIALLLVRRFIGIWRFFFSLIIMFFYFFLYISWLLYNFLSLFSIFNFFLFLFHSLIRFYLLISYMIFVKLVFFQTEFNFDGTFSFPFLIFSTDDKDFNCWGNVDLLYCGELFCYKSSNRKGFTDEDSKTFQDNEVIFLKKFLCPLQIKVNISFPNINFIETILIIIY